MAQSTITSKYQTTVPREIREKLSLGPRDHLHWEVEGARIVVVPARKGFLERRGSIQVGSGSPLEDVRQARQQRG